MLFVVDLGDGMNLYIELKLAWRAEKKAAQKKLCQLIDGTMVRSGYDRISRLRPIHTFYHSTCYWATPLIKKY